MQKQLCSLLIIILFCSNIIGQKINEIEHIIVPFDQIEKEVLESAFDERRKYINYDFNIIDSIYFENHSLTDNLYTDSYSRKNFKENFELKISKTKTVSFHCEEVIKEKCIQYLGYLQNLECHVLSQCDEICITYLMSAGNGSVIVLPGEFDHGVSVASTGKYLIVWSSYDYFEDYYNIRSHIDVYEKLKYKHGQNYREIFDYIGSIESKNWSISKLFPSNSESNIFLIKIYNSSLNTDYMEIEIK